MAGGHRNSRLVKLEDDVAMYNPGSHLSAENITHCCVILEESEVSGDFVLVSYQLF